MILDVILFLVMTIFVFFGFKNGFFYGVPRFIGLLIAIIFSLIATPHVVTFLKTNTSFYDSFHKSIFDSSVSIIDNYVGGAPEHLPFGLSGLTTDVTSNLVTSAVKRLSDTGFTIIVFLVIMILIKIIIWLITRKFSKKRTDVAFIGGIDGIMGILLGIVKGIVVIYVILLVLFPLTYTLNQSMYYFLNEQVTQSLVAQLFINHNPINALSEGFSVDNFLPSNWHTFSEVVDVGKDVDNMV